MPHNQNDQIEQMNFTIKKLNGDYRIDLHLLENRTEVFYLGTNPNNYAQLLVRLQKVVKGITPQNAASKLQTLLTFS